MEDAVCGPLLTPVLSPPDSPLQRFPHGGSRLLEEAEPLCTTHAPGHRDSSEVDTDLSQTKQREPKTSAGTMILSPGGMS